MNELRHHGIKGQKWGVRRYQNPDGTLTPEGKVQAFKRLNRLDKQNAKVFSKHVTWTGDEKRYERKYRKLEKKLAKNPSAFTKWRANRASKNMTKAMEKRRGVEHEGNAIRRETKQILDDLVKSNVDVKVSEIERHTSVTGTGYNYIKNHTHEYYRDYAYLGSPKVTGLGTDVYYVNGTPIIDYYAKTKGKKYAFDYKHNKGK